MDPLGGINEVVHGIDLSFDTQFSQDRQSGGRDNGVQSLRELRNTDATGLSLSPEKRQQIEELRARDQAAAASGSSGTGSTSRTQAATGTQAASSTSSSSSADPAAAESGVEGGRPKDTDATGLRLSEEEKQQVDELKARDREVRTHEQAHMSAAGGVSVSGPSFSYQKGPDGQMYATGGEVQIDTSKGNSPEDTISRARSIRAAANAPAQPSGQDRSVAAQASQMEAEARKELGEQRSSSQTDRASGSDPSSSTNSASQADPNAQGLENGQNPVATAQAVSPAPSASPGNAPNSGGRRSLSSVPSYGVSGDSGWTGPTSGYLQHDSLRSPVDPSAGPSQRAMAYGAMKYANWTPERALAPMGTGFNLAV